MSAVEQPDTATSIDNFLNELFAHVDTGYLHLFTLDRTNGQQAVIWKPVNDIAGLTREAQRLTNTSCVWFGAAPRAAAMGARRGGSNDCTVITAAWVDIDVAGPNHAADNLPPDRDAARLLLADFPLQPSAIIDTGGGIQAWWFLNEPAEHDNAIPFLTRWGATWAELGAHRSWHVDNVFDMARILRLPNTVNRKGDPQAVTITDWHPERRYGLDDLDQWTIEPPEPPQRAADRNVPYIGPERPGDAFNAATDPAALLEHEGWIFDHQDRTTGDRQYRAPHHAGERGVTGATVYADGHTTIWSETFANARGLKVKRPYDAFGLYTHLKHAGDWRAATEALSTAGYGERAVVLTEYLGPPTTTPTEPEDDDWSIIDLVPIARLIRTGQLEPTRPTVLDVRDGFPLFYPERINSLFGESGGGKTWVGLAAGCETVRQGGWCAMLDYEDNSNGIAERLVLLGLDDDQISRFHYRNPTTAIGRGVTNIIATGTSYDLIIIDSTGEAMAAGGVNSDSDTEVALWFAWVKQLTRLPGGPTVIVLDHIPKAVDAPSLFGIGSQRKRAAVTGAAYRVDTIKEPARGRDGLLKLTVAKDRPGSRARGSVACHIDVRTSDELLSIECHLSEAAAAAAAGQRFRPTVYMERVSRWLEDNPDATTREIQNGVSGRKEIVAEAVDVLVEEGWVKVSTGARGARIHRVERAYSEVSDLTKPLSPVSPTVPDRPRGTDERLSPVPRPPKTGDGGDGQFDPQTGHPGDTSVPQQTPPLTAFKPPDPMLDIDAIPEGTPRA